jgi:hypothetical protein
VAGEVADATVGAAAATIDRGPQARWRFTRQHGEWWYYTPDNQWMYHRGGQWHAYQQQQPVGPVHDPQMAQQVHPAPQGPQHTTGYRGAEAQAHAAVNQPQPAQQQQPVPAGAPVYNQGAGYAAPQTAYRQSGRRYSYAPEVSRVPAGNEGNVESRYRGGAQSPRELNNNPRSATWGAVKR